MKTNLRDFDHLIFNYYPGAAGDLLLSALLDLDLSLNHAHRNSLPTSLYQIKGFEKTRDNRPYKWEAADKDWFCDQLIQRNMRVPQSCHFVSFLDAEHLDRVNEMYKIYQIIVEPELRMQVEFFNIIKNAPGNHNNIEQLQQKVNLMSTRNIDNYHRIAARTLDKVNVLSFQKLFYPPFDDFRMLYNNIRRKEPDLIAYQRRTKHSLNLPEYLNIFGRDIEIDIENYKIKVL
jgi:hypothetical protein